MNNGQTMLIAFDGSEEAARALEYAAKLLRPEVVEILTAWEPAALQAARAVSRTGMHQSTVGAESNAIEDDPAYAEAKELCRQGVAVAEGLGLAGRAHLVEVSTNIAAAIVESAHELDVDVIVTGTRGLTGLRAWWNSSTAEHIVRNSGVPVFVVPPEEEEEYTD
ncbi:universal stress protein [Corynebacterium phocae]|uniref:Universal stress protein n=1 Tax=Corynebacterium phocae TaxID=161895 RepID=A0A1L7D5D1_9CORY|nr:universal stress protein [Corynebacterium phocae]APT93376.1 universal stress protein [Corynebacterium phocae]KAA8721718.1 universal stress protein [Corynebacterium phocae]